MKTKYYEKEQAERFYSNISAIANKFGVCITVADYKSKLPKYMHGVDKLPSIDTLKRMKTNSSLTEYTAKQIVKFLSDNFEPKYTCDEYCTKDLTNVDFKCITESQKNVDPILEKLSGTYKCYYPSENGDLFGGILRIEQDNSVQYIDCIKFKDSFKSPCLRDFLKGNFTFENFKKLKSKLGEFETACYYYKRNLKINKRNLVINLSDLSEKNEKDIYFHADIYDFTSRAKYLDTFNSSIFFVIKPNDNNHALRYYNMGIVPIEKDLDLF